MSISDKLFCVQAAVIRLHRNFFDESSSPMKLQKLCYYAQGYALAETGELFPDDFQAWQRGPVIPTLYHMYKQFGWRLIDVDVSDKTHPNENFISDIVYAYGRYDGAALSTMTHREDPWLEARGNLPEDEGCTEMITKRSMLRFFKTKLLTHEEE